MIEVVRHERLQLDVVAFTTDEHGWMTYYLHELGVAGTLLTGATKMAVQPCPIDPTVTSENFDQKVQRPLFKDLFEYFEIAGISVSKQEADHLHITERAQETVLGRYLMRVAEKAAVEVVFIPDMTALLEEATERKPEAME